MTTANVQPDNRGVLYTAPTVEVYMQASEGGRSADEPNFNGLDVLRPWWSPQRLQWGINGRTSILTLRRQMGIGPGRPAQEHPDPVPMQSCSGDRVRVVQAMPGGMQAEMFRGHVGRIETLIQSEPDVESLEVTAYGPEIRLGRTVITGAWYKTTAADDKAIAGTLSTGDAVRSQVFATNLPAVFNPGGRPNASGDSPLWRLTDKTASGQVNACKVFEEAGRVVRAADGSTRIRTTYWTAWTALRSVIEYWDNFETISYTGTNWQAIHTLLSDLGGQEYPIERVNVTGMDLLEAIRAILLPIGFGFAIEPWCCEGNCHRLLVFSLHEAAAIKRPPMATISATGHVAADSPEGRRAQVQRLHFVRDHHDVRNEVLVVGDQIRRQVVLEFHADEETRDLHPAWDTTASENDLDTYDKDDCIGGWGNGDWADATAKANFESQFGRWPTDSNRHVFRTFVWNEDGAWSHVVTDADGNPRIPDLDDYGLSSNAVRRARPVGASLKYADAAGGQGRTGAHVEIGIDGDDSSWIRLPGESAHIHRDRAAFTITETPIDAWCPFARASKSLSEDYGHHTYLTLLHNTLRNSGTGLRFRLVGSIACDECVTGLAERLDDSAWPFRSRKVVYLPDRFKRRDVDGSQLAGYDVVDDGEAATAYAQCVRDGWEDAAAHGSLVLRGIHRSYSPGDGVDRTGGRNVPLTIDGRQGGKAGRVAPIVVAIVWDLAEGANKTQLVLDSPRTGKPL